MSRRSNFCDINCSPNLFTNATHHLTEEQVQFLNRGPTYVIPCQMHLLSTASTLNQVLTNQVIPLRRQLTKLFKQYPMDLQRQNAFRRDMEREFVKAFTLPIPTALEKRVFHEKQVIESIRYQLQKDNLILRRTCDEYNTYYLSDRIEFQAKCLEYMEDHTQCFFKIYDMDENISEAQHLTEMTKSINSALNQLELKYIIGMEHLNKFRIRDSTPLQLPYLYFLPEPNLELSVQPRFSTWNNSPIYPLATFLNQILRPLFDKYMEDTRLIDGTDFIEKLQHFTLNKRSFTTDTRFVIYELHHLFLRITHDDLLGILKRILIRDLAGKRYHGLKQDGFVELVRVVLSHLAFTYDGKLYRFSRGGPTNLPLIDSLIDIYLQYWQLGFYRHTDRYRQFYARYRHTGIFTWNSSDDELAGYVLELNEQYPDMPLTLSSSLHVRFLDVYVENLQGRLLSTVHRDRRRQQYFLLPYSAKHPRLTHRQWFRFALTRAVQYCSFAADFQQERLEIELTFLANGYSLRYVQYLLQQFLKRHPSPKNSFTFNKSSYDTFRHDIFRYCNARQVKSSENGNPVQLEYLFDWGKRHEFNQKFYQLWSTQINADPNFQKLNLKIILTTKHCYLSNTLLSR